MHRYALGILLVLALAGARSADPISFSQVEDGAQHTTQVGLPLQLRDVVLEGDPVVVRQADLGTPLVLRIVSSDPHGNATRYTFEAYALEAGTYDLRDYLQREDGTSLAEVEPLTVQVRSVLPPGAVEPHRPESRLLPRLGGYRLLLIGAGVVWVLVLFLLLKRSKRPTADVASIETEETLADRLKPLIAEAMAGRLAREDQAELERMLIGFWRERLGLSEANAAQALRELRAHDEAGALLRQLEDWLHRPDPVPGIDLHQLLAPYQDLPATSLVGGKR